MRNASAGGALQLAGVAEGSHRKKRQQPCHRNRQNDPPARRVAGPGAKRGVEPAERQNRKRRADNFVKKLPEGAPQAAKTARGGSRCRARGGGHRSILTQNRPPNRNAMRRQLRGIPPGIADFDGGGFVYSRRTPGWIRVGKVPCGRIGDNGAKLSCIQHSVGLKWHWKYGRTPLATR
jgi:hypothetical protein